MQSKYHMILFLLVVCLLQSPARAGVLTVDLINPNQTASEITFDIRATLNALSGFDDVYSLTLGLENSSLVDFAQVSFETLPLDNTSVIGVLPWVGSVDSGNARLFLDDFSGDPLLNGLTKILGRLRVGTSGFLAGDYTISLDSTINDALGSQNLTSGYPVVSAEIAGGNATFSVSNISAVPEPSSCWLLGIGVVAASLLRKSRRS